MIVLDSHVWFWWINLEHHRLASHLLEEIAKADCVGVSPVSCLDGKQASVDGQFDAYPELSGRLLGRKTP